MSNIYQSVFPQNFYLLDYQTFNTIKGSKKQMELFSINYFIA